MKYLAAMAAIFALTTTRAMAATPSGTSSEPVQLTDAELDQVVAGDPLIFVNVAAMLNVHVDPITVTVDIPVNVAAIVQANVMGNAVFDALAVGTQNVFQAASALTPIK
jgi:hypothetical protein